MVSEEKMKIVINNYFKKECSVNTSIREAFEKGFRIGVSKMQKKQGEWQLISEDDRCDLIENASSVEAYPFEQVQELVKLNQQFAQEIENLKKPQGEQIPVSKIPNDREYDEGFNAGYAEAIKNIPEYRKLADKLQRHQGKWKFDGWSIYCSECGYRPKIGGSNFCSECGADMRGEKNERL